MVYLRVVYMPGTSPGWYMPGYIPRVVGIPPRYLRVVGIPPRYLRVVYMPGYVPFFGRTCPGMAILWENMPLRTSSFCPF